MKSESRDDKIRWYNDKIVQGNSLRFVDFNTPPQTVDNPNADAKCFALTEGNALVSVSAVMSLVEQ
jgi:hypothetical protein